MSSWHTKEWQATRKALIGDRCEQCGASEGPMVLQHHWHPPVFAKVLREASVLLSLPEYTEEVKDKACQMHRNNQDRYMSGADTSTWCSKCAYLKDKHSMVICKDCGKHYHKDDKARCRHCEEKRSNMSYGDLFGGK
jgi:hypothetical protein